MSHKWVCKYEIPHCLTKIPALYLLSNIDSFFKCHVPVQHQAKIFILISIWQHYWTKIKNIWTSLQRFLPKSYYVFMLLNRLKHCYTFLNSHILRYLYQPKFSLFLFLFPSPSPCDRRSGQRHINQSDISHHCLISLFQLYRDTAIKTNRQRGKDRLCHFVQQRLHTGVFLTPTPLIRWLKHTAPAHSLSVAMHVCECEFVSEKLD